MNVRHAARGSSTLALDHAESFAREDFLGGPSNAAALTLVDELAGLAEPDRGAGRAGRLGQEPPRGDLGGAAGARAPRRARARSSDVPAALATGALVVEDARRGAASTSARCFICSISRARRTPIVLLTARTRAGRLDARGSRSGSRLKALPVVALAPPDDALLRAVLVKLFADRQLAVDEGLIGYRRDPDRALLCRRPGAWWRSSTRRRCAGKRPLTRALAAELLRAREP